MPKAKRKISAKTKLKLKKDLNEFHKATHDFAAYCIDLMKGNKKGLKKIEKSVKKLAANMDAMDKHIDRVVK